MARLSRLPFLLTLWATFMGFILSARPVHAAPPDKPKAKASSEEEIEVEPEDVTRSGPPSKTLERAKKLYDKGDYYSASIEFDKVVKGTEDSQANKQKGQFFLGKTLFHLKFYAAALVNVDNIVQKGPSHKYFRRTLQWLAALAE